MKKVTISLNTVDKVKSFVNTISKFDATAELQSEPYTVDAKSIMGIFSLDLAKPVTLVLHESEDRITEAVRPYAVA